MVKHLPANADVRDAVSIPGLGRSPGGGNGNPLQYSYWENSMDRGAWWGKIHGVAKSQTQLKPLSIYLCKQVRINLNISISWKSNLIHYVCLLLHSMGFYHLLFYGFLFTVSAFKPHREFRQWSSTFKYYLDIISSWQAVCKQIPKITLENVEFQRITRRDKKAFLTDQCKEIEENNRMGKTRDLFKKIRDTKQNIFMQRWSQ